MEVFTQFSSDLDDATKRQLVYGQGLMRLLRQKQYHPFSQHEQVITLVAALKHVMQDVPLNRMEDFRRELLEFVEEQAPELCGRIDGTGKLPDEDREQILTLAKQFRDQFLNAGKRGA